MAAYIDSNDLVHAGVADRRPVVDVGRPGDGEVGRLEQVEGGALE